MSTPDAGRRELEVVAIAEHPPYWARLAALADLERREPSIRVAHLDLDTLLPRPHDSRTPRKLRFATDSRAVLLTVVSHPRTISISIGVTPPTVVGVDIRPLHGVVRRVWTDEQGRAECRSLPPGPISLLVQWPASEGGAVRTAWTQM